MKQSQRFIRVFGGLCLVVTAASGACDVQKPDRLVRSPVIKNFSPKVSHIDGLVGDTLNFSVRAIDPDYIGLNFFFTMAESTVSDTSDWEYVINDTGLVTVSAHASNGDRESVVRWTLEREQPINEPPIIVSWTPVEPRPQIIFGSIIEFTVFAQDPEGGPLTYIFTVNDTVVTSSSRFVFVSRRVGQFVVKGIASDGEAFALHSWDLFVGAEPDSVLPAPVAITSLVTGLEAGELIVDFVAVGDDGMEGVASNYEVRTSSVPIETETAWSNASNRTGVPPPATPGTIQRMVARNLKPANQVHVAVRAQDDFGNLSPLANSPYAFSKGMELFGTLRDALTGDPVQGFNVALLGNHDVTGADGKFALTALPDDIAEIHMWDDDDPFGYGAYFDIRVPNYDVVNKDVKDYWLVPDIPMDSPEYPDMLSFIKRITLTAGNGLGTLNPVWVLPCSVYVPEYEQAGVSYHDIINDRLDMWEQEVGRDLFVPVGHVPQIGFYFQYQSGARERYEFLIVQPPRMPVLGRIWIDKKYDGSNDESLFVVSAHEIGHALGVDHSVDQLHLMIGGRAPSRNTPTQDEILMMRIIYNIPRGTDYRHYVFE